MIGDEEVEAILKSINKDRENWQLGEEGALMEKEAADYLGVKHCILTSSGSAAGLLALSALELKKGTEVIIPAVTFPTIFNIIVQCGLVPVVVDCKVGTYNIDTDKLEEAISDDTTAIIAVHAVGNPADINRIVEIAFRRGLKVIEDGCDSWGSAIFNKKLGSFGDVSITSFHAAHIVSMGVGGAVFTNDDEIAKKVRQYRDWGRQANITEPHKVGSLPKDHNPRFVYEKIGYNFQILELQAAMGRVQLKKTEKIKFLRKANFDYFYEHLSKFSELIMPELVEGADVCWFSFPLTTIGEREPLVAFLEEKGIETRSMFAGNIIKHPAYRNTYYRVGNELKGADYILEHSFWFSVHPRLTQADREYIVKAFEDYYAQAA